MATTAPATFNIIAGSGGSEIAMGESIVGDTGDTVGDIVRNATHAKCKCNRRAVAGTQHAGSTIEKPITTTSVSWETLHQGPLYLSNMTDHLVLDGRGDNLDIQVLVFEDSGFATLIATISDSSGAAEGDFTGTTSSSLSSSGYWSGDEDLHFKVQIKTQAGSGTGELLGYTLYEDVLAAGDLA